MQQTSRVFLVVLVVQVLGGPWARARSSVAETPHFKGVHLVPCTEFSSEWHGRMASRHIGSVELHDKIALKISVDTASGINLRISSEVWGFGDWLFSSCQVYKDRLVASGLSGEDGHLDLRLKPAGLEGVYRWRDLEYSVTADAGLRQYPVPALKLPTGPFPYSNEHVVISKERVPIEVNISTPAGTRNGSVLILIGGSSPASSIPQVPGLPGTTPGVWPLSDALCRAGFITIRLSDRGVGQSGGTKAESSADDLAADVMEAIRFVKGRRGAEHASIGIVGWSAGTVIARMVAANDRNEVSYLVLLAPPVLPLDEVFINQWKALQALIPKNITDVGMPAEAELRLRTAAYSAAADESKSSEDVKRAIMSVKFTIDPNDRLSPRRVAAIVSNATGELTRSLMAAHAKFKISSTRQPVLAIFGDRDITVDGTANYHAYLKARQQGVPGDAVHLIGALDHSLRRVREERGQLVYAIDPELASLVAKWCKDRVSNRER